MRTMTKKSKVAAAVASVALVAVGGGAAYAYWTTTGTGGGSAANSTGGGTVTLHATFDAGLAPGNSVPVAYTADNASTTDTVVGLLTATVTTSAPTTCLPSWFTVSAVTTNSTVAATTSGVSVGSGTLAFLNSTANQDACKDATVTVNVTSQ